MNTHSLKTWAVLTAGGQSHRFQADAQAQGLTLPTNKLLSLLDAQPVLWHSLRALVASMPFEGVVITASADALPDFQAIVDTLQAQYPQTPLFLIEGGADRRASVQAGLAKIKTLVKRSPDFVVIHDGARPLLPVDFLPVAMHAFEDAPTLNGVIAGHPLTDTIKRTGDTSQTPCIEGTVARHDLWAVQTPQVFRWHPLWDAHQQVAWDATITDDAELVERHLGKGSALRLWHCGGANLKITTPDDLALARFWLSRYTNSHFK